MRSTSRDWSVQSGWCTGRRPNDRATTSTPDSPLQFDAVLHLDHTHALEPLERTTEWLRGEPPETYPTGL